MAELSIQTAVTCKSNIDWSVDVKLHSGPTTNCYVVRYGELDSKEKEKQGYQYGYICGCKAFRFRKQGDAHYCKHIKAIIEDGVRCGWNQRMKYLEMVPACPRCGEEVTPFSIGV